jgi:UDP-N-acetylglucosamine 4,6-dehydratase
MKNFNFDNSNILITGGTGSFGKAFVQYLLNNFKPNKVVILSRDEFKQYEMSKSFNDPCMRYFLGDVRDSNRMVQAFEGIDYVIHAAAMKQVEASEYNPTECIQTNVQGAENVISASFKNDVTAVVALSTDKAASPLNLYGATKLVSDKLFTAANNIKGDKDISFSVVRYGNVAGSRGSVIPRYRELLLQGQKALPVTDEKMTRFWISLQQGVDFVAKTFSRMHGGEIFIPKLPSIRILDLAKAMNGDNEVTIVGIGPGEKIHELMIPEDSAHMTIEFDDFYIIRPEKNSFASDVNYLVTKIGENGKSVPSNFEYSSGTNQHFLNHEEILEFNRILEQS